MEEGKKQKKIAWEMKVTLAVKFNIDLLRTVAIYI